MENIAPVTPLPAANAQSINVWSPGTPRTPSQIARVRYRENEYFRLWRDGRKDEWEAPQWRIPLQDLPPRRSGAWDGQILTPSSGAVRRRRDNRTSIRYYPSGSGSLAPTFIQTPTNRMLSMLQGVSLVKILGYGGQGVACLVAVTDRQGTTRQAVMKMSIGDDDWSTEDLSTEKNWQVSLMRAMHVVQLIKWSTLRGRATTPEDVQVDNNPRLYFMELMKNGDLHEVIGRAGTSGQKLPNKLLWKIFACLIRGCIAMRYPPKLRRIISQTQADWVSDEGPDILEEVPADPGVRTARDYDLVHFDLDPKNIFIGDFDSQGHEYVPRLKVADLGLADRTTGELLTTP
ncbi:hypothetical protein N8I77_003526 [Diaporthe amygdali]|uniref:Protein kinase domain-containing protein n=1 Tax=Phomopsis amygdali TaxID=1214568 RepID=A0AAD9SK46_PHOAM|nr:hypothetical protein N8I77_003526 [Diaporthe amygdali]